ncbi:hypothetical protein HYU22_03275 [Candidatus Woesearchaeota archaeon]|nr:hypothetical protein [Candidatus Woesearchaeota archaeon]
MDDSYQVGDICSYSEERYNIKVRVLENRSNNDNVSYLLQVLEIISPPVPSFLSPKIGATIECSEARTGYVCRGVPILERILKQSELPAVL